MGSSSSGSGTATGRGTNRAGAVMGGGAEEAKQERRSRAGARATQAGSENAMADAVSEDGPLPEAEMGLGDRIDNIVGRLAGGGGVGGGKPDAASVERLLADSGMTREDLDIRIRIRREEIESERRRAEAAAREPVREAAADLRTSAAEKAQAMRREADRIEAEGRQEAAAMMHELADEAAPKEGERISDAVVRAAYDAWQEAKMLSQHARHRLTIGLKMLQENDRLARGHMQRKAQEYMRLKDALERAAVGGAA